MSEIKAEKKKVVLSLVQPTGTPTLGNYLGAFKNWTNMASEHDCLFGVADLHAITVRQVPSELRENTLSILALFIAMGLNPEKETIFIQSQVPEHSQLAWLLNCYTQFGEASRMTQFKEKSQKHADNINVGLFTYPSLMAADILLYQADFVPVGDDQKQHLELTRNIADRINGIYNNVFKVPEPYIGKAGARIMSLTEPDKKMSKSDPNQKSYISLTDTAAQITKKIKSAVTDSEGSVYFSKDKLGIANLMNINSCCTNKTYEEIETEFSGKGYGDFKTKVADALVEELRPMQEKHKKLILDKAYLLECAKKGADIASMRGDRTLKKVMKKIGFLQI